MQEFFQPLFDSMLELSLDPNLSLYASLCAATSLALFVLYLAIALKSHAVKPEAMEAEFSVTTEVEEVPYHPAIAEMEEVASV